MQEKRQFTRFRKSYTVNFSLKDSPSESHDISKLSDISRGGLSFFAIQEYPKGTVFNLKVQFPYYAHEISLEGEVVNIQKVSQNNIYKIGVKFINLSSEATKALDEMDQANSDKPVVSERREHPRLEKNLMAVYYAKDSLGAVHSLIWFNDISKGGMKFFSLEAYPLGTLFVFNIQFPYLYPQLTLIEGKVIGCDDILPGKTYRIRVSFSNLGPEASMALEQLEKFG